jgi:hypothetical protein
MEASINKFARIEALQFAVAKIRQRGGERILVGEREIGFLRVHLRGPVKGLQREIRNPLIRVAKKGKSRFPEND